MTRSISVWYTTQDGHKLDVDVGNSFLFGCQSPSKEFWSLPIHAQLKAERLRELGVSDPVWFVGWDDLALLEKELMILEQNIERIPYPDDPKRTWIGNLRIYLDRLKAQAPVDSVPEFMIG